MLAFPEANKFCNLARPGLALYGVSPFPDQQDKLKPVLTWKTRVLLVRELPAGHRISYGSSKILDRPTKVAATSSPCGYGDGYPRQVSGKGASVLDPRPALPSARPRHHGPNHGRCHRPRHVRPAR